jgi:hypothetical protein
MIAAVAATAIGSGVGVANAQDIEFGIRAPHVYVGPVYHYRHWRDRYAYLGDCRVIVHRHVNRFGERVVTRERVCD